MENKDLTMLAIDTIRGTVEGNYSKNQTGETIRKAIIDMNGGTKFDPRKFRPGTELFALIETLIPVIRNESFDENNPLLELVERRNINDGDLNEFYTEGEANFIVADVAAGIQGVRRQRILDGEKVVVKTTPKIIRVYENLGRLLSGRITWDKFVQGVADAANRQTYDAMYTAVNGLSKNTAGLSEDFMETGTYDENKLLVICEKLKAFTKKDVKILGSLMALRKVKLDSVGETALTSKYNIGYYNSLAGIPMIRLAQSFKPGTKNFVLDDNKLFLIASDDKPIKYVTEGDGYLTEKTADQNADLTQEYTYIYRDGIGAIAAAPMGLYTIS